MLDQAALSNCDKEPIHIVGAIQPHGLFLAFRLNDETVYHASANTEAWLQRSPRKTCGSRLPEILSPELSKVILTAAREVSEERPQYIRLASPWHATKTLEIYLFALNGLIGLEMEEQDLTPGFHINDLSSAHRRTQDFVEELHAGETLEDLAKLTCKAIRAATSFDRVMMYRYLPNWDGEVIAEDKAAEVHSFMSHRFPATDIPLPARVLYLKNRSRLIADSAAVAEVIEPAQHYLTRKPIDLSHSKLRAVSPIHLHYLRNMGVKSSFSLAVIVDGELWGLIACHGIEMRIPSFEIRLVCETIASTFAALAKIKEQFAEQARKINFELGARRLFTELAETRALLDTLMKNHLTIESLFETTGVAVVSDDGVKIAGLTPPEEITKEFAQDLKAIFEKSGKGILAIDNLGAFEPKFEFLKEICCGILATFSPLSGNSIFILFRPEALRTITWGGDPRKTLAKRQYQGPINPRESFESWQQTIRGQSKPWRTYEIQGAEFLKDFVFDSLVRKEKLIEELGRKLKIT